MINYLQDWPPEVKLAETHPRLYQDFSVALPIPEYTRQDGFYNLAAHFPINSVVWPDLGMFGDSRSVLLD